MGYLGQQLLRSLVDDARRVDDAHVLGSDEAARLYEEHLAGAGATMRRANEPDTVRRREAIGRELSSWLLSLPPSYPRDLMGVRPEDLLVFMRSYWLPRHAGSTLDGAEGPVASPQAVDSNLSHLSTLFAELGRMGP